MPARHHTKSVEFRDISGDPGYQVGDDGSVRSLWGKGARKPGAVWKFLKPRACDKYGHLQVYLRKRGNIYVHILVLEAFVGHCPDDQECRHLDGNALNNNLWNLVWGTPSENSQDSIRHGTHSCLNLNGENNFNSKLSERDIREIRLTWSHGVLSQRQIGEKFGVIESNISQIVLRKTWKHID